jgi:predicted Fe-S protein YdhL (DUF1289 family)
MGKENVSPCENVCKTSQGRCIHCGRTREDIAVWRSLSVEEQKERIQELKEAGYLNEQ